MTVALSPFLDGYNPPALLIPDDLLTADAVFDESIKNRGALARLG